MGNPAVVRLSGPSDLVEVVPQFLGFVPSDSLVGVLTARGRMVVTMRSDSADGVQLAAEAVLRAASHTGADTVYLLGYGSAVVGEMVVGLARLLRPAMGVGLAVLVSPELRWRHADDCTCCPVEGHPCSRDSAASLEIRLITGTEPAASRASFEARLDRTERAARLAALPAPGEPESEAELLDAAAAVLLGDEPVEDLADEVLARAGRALSTDPMADALLCCLCPRTVPLSEFGPLGAAVAQALPVPWEPADRIPARRTRDRFVQLCAALPDRSASQPLALLAMFSWWCGDGALAWVASDRALAAEPGSRLAALTQRLLAEAVPPPD